MSKTPSLYQEQHLTLECTLDL